MKQNRNTAQRQLIRNIMQDNYLHPTADEVYELARQKVPTISRGTVYRNLNFLVDNGELVRLTMPGGPDHYDCQTQNHYHFFCRKCNRVLDTGLPYDNKLNTADSSLPGSKTEWHKLILVGLCPDCNKEEQ